MNEAIERSNPEFPPKIINGCVWKLREKSPGMVNKPSRGVFQLLKYRN
ncbi:hypothetical protein GF319_01825 [Candidatus Bathyarchaeota archaeon]|nr:hypothetical protein [Candidatus Bathyarchaeota archaeon]